MRLTPGQVLYLPVDLPGIPAGPWVLIQQDRQMILNRLGENEDGRLCLLWRRVPVTSQQLRWFAPISVRLSLRQEVEDRERLPARL